MSALLLAAVLAAADGGPAPSEPDPDPDADLVRHLDEIEDLELLQNLELFDPKPEEAGPDGGAR